MTALAQKQHFNRRLNQAIQQKVTQFLSGLGQALPAKVLSINGSIVTVSLQLANTGFVLPQITCPVAESFYLRLPIQVGDLGLVVPATVNIGNVSGLGTGTPDFSTPGNLAALYFLPIANKSWTTPDPNAVVLGGPNGAIIRTIDGKFTITVSDTQITLVGTPGGGASVTLDSSGNITVAGNNINLNGTLKINGATYTAHEHSGVTTGSGNTGGVV